MAKVTWALEARQDLQAIYLFVGRESTAYADSLIETLVNAVERLSIFPYSGQMVPEQQNPNVRQVRTMGYRIFHVVEGEDVTVVGVWHSARPLRLSDLPG